MFSLIILGLKVSTNISALLLRETVLQSEKEKTIYKVAHLPDLIPVINGYSEKRDAIGL